MKSVFHALDKEVTVGTCTALSPALAEPLKTQPSLAVYVPARKWGQTRTVQQEEMDPFCKASLGIGSKGKYPSHSGGKNISLAIY